MPQQKLRNAPAVKPADPEKNGYDFAGWYLEDTQYAFDTNVTNDITLKAHWTPAAASTITTAAVENVNFNYQPGDAPQATARVSEADTDKYEIAYECWQEFENNEPVAAWYSDNGSHGSLPTITKFESGKKYVYSLMLNPKDGYSFSSETVTVNGEKVAAPFVGGSMYIPAIKTITMPTVTVIDVVEINDVTVSFKDGDKPVFTGKVPDGANYAYRCEWWELDSKTGAMSTDFGNFYENKITAFEAGKTYHYGVYVKAVGYVESENTTYVFGPNTKLKINGEFVNYKRYEGDASDGSDGTMWVLTDLTMTPESSGMAPEYKVIEGANGTWKQNSDGTLTFRANGEFSKFTGVKVDDQLVDAKNYTAISGSTIVTLSADYLKTLSIGNHTLTVLFNDGDCSTNFTVQVAGSSTTPSNPGSGTGSGTTPSNPNGGTSGSATTPSGSSGTKGAATTAGGTKVTGTNTANLNKAPKTGEDSPLALWIGVLCVSAFGMVGTTIYSRKKKYTK